MQIWLQGERGEQERREKERERGVRARAWGTTPVITYFLEGKRVGRSPDAWRGMGGRRATRDVESRDVIARAPAAAAAAAAQSSMNMDRQSATYLRWWRYCTVQDAHAMPHVYIFRSYTFRVRTHAPGTGKQQARAIDRRDHRIDQHQPHPSPVNTKGETSQPSALEG